MKYVIIRTYSAGVHCGYLESQEYTPAGIVVVLKDTRRIWKWMGAFTLSELSKFGPKNPDQCMFSVEIDNNTLVAIEIIPTTKEAQDILQGVKNYEY